VDFSEGIEVCDCDFGRRQSDNGAILLMKGVDVEDALACDNGPLETEMRKASIPRAWDVSCGTCEADVDELPLMSARTTYGKMRYAYLRYQ
jgi:hypothetical protein